MDAETMEPLIGVHVKLADIDQGGVTDITGTYSIERVAVGSYTLVFSYIGYETLAKTDVIVKSQRITFTDARLTPSVLEGETIVVESGYFAEVEDQPTSVVKFSHEEVRRAPGSAGDVSRILYGLPAVAKVSDTRNSLIVRGGGPIENGFYIDNIEIPNINHFPEQGSSGGPIGIINVDFIEDVAFHTGGFSAQYGDRLSSIMDMRFRKGNREEFDAQLDMSLVGLGGIAEGGLGDHGSWMMSLRRSYLDLIVQAIEGDNTYVPEYGDLQGKVFFEAGPRHHFTVLGVSSIDESSITGEEAIESEESIYTDFNFRTHTAGINWMYLWGKRGFSETSVAWTTGVYDYRGFETRELVRTGEQSLLFDMNPRETEYKLRNVTRYRFAKNVSAEVGLDLKYIVADYDNFYGAYNDELGQATEAFYVQDRIEETKAGAFATMTISPGQRLSIMPGIRVDRFSYNGNTNLSPRLSLRYQVNADLAINAAAGVFHQFLPLPLLAQNETSKDLRDPVAYHLVVGIRHMLSDDTQLVLEAYAKEYDHFPLDPLQPQLFIIDQVVDTGVYLNNNPLVDTGKARTRGIELMVQKKLARNVYGLLSGAYFRSSYRDYDGIWRDREFDNRFTFQAEGGYKPSNKWEFSARWLYAGGRPYTPFDQAASRAAIRGVLDAGRINADRLPAYHSLNVRFDRRFHYRRSNLILYVSVWNAYNRNNIGGYYWNEVTNEQETLEQWALIPIFGLEFEF